MHTTEYRTAETCASISMASMDCFKIAPAAQIARRKRARDQLPIADRQGVTFSYARNFVKHVASSSYSSLHNVSNVPFAKEPYAAENQTSAAEGRASSASLHRISD